MNPQPTKEQVAACDKQREQIYKEQENMSIEKAIKEASEEIDKKLVEARDIHAELVSELEGEIETLEGANEALKALSESLAEELEDAKNELLAIEEKGLSI